MRSELCAVSSADPRAIAALRIDLSKKRSHAPVKTNDSRMDTTRKRVCRGLTLAQKGTAGSVEFHVWIGHEFGGLFPPPALLSSEEARASARIRRREAESGCAPRRDEAVGGRAAGVAGPRVCQARVASELVSRLERASAKERRHSQRTPVMAREEWMYWPRSGAVTTLPGWPFPIGQALPMLFGSQRL